MHSRYDRGEFSGPYARDPKPDLGSDYARDGGWSGAGRHDDYAREVDPRPSYRGRGPKNWPSDTWLVETVNVLLTEHDGIDATDVEVTAESGEITLSGMVGSRWEKRLAEDIAWSVRNVRDVHNRLRVSDREVQIGKTSE